MKMYLVKKQFPDGVCYSVLPLPVTEEVCKFMQANIGILMPGDLWAYEEIQVPDPAGETHEIPVDPPMTKREEMRQQFWREAWLAHTGDAIGNQKGYAKIWADHALEDFDATFPATPAPAETNKG